MTLIYDGVDDRVTTASVTGVPTGYPFAVGAVVRRSGQGAYHSLVQLGRGVGADRWGVELADTNTLEVSNNVAGAVNSTGTVPNTTWMFVGYSGASSTSHRFFCYNYETRAVVFNEANTDLLVLGVSTPNSLKVGAFETGAGSYTDFFNGRFSWLGIYDVDLTGNAGDAFLAMANLGPYMVRAPTQLYTFLEGTTTSIFDRRGGLTGTMTNFPVARWEPMSLPGPWWELNAPIVLRPQAVGGTTFTVDLAGAFTPPGALTKAMLASLLGAFTPAGVAQATKIVVGAVQAVRHFLTLLIGR